MYRSVEQGSCKALLEDCMEYRHVGEWGLRISVLGLGSYLTIGFKAEAEASRDMVLRGYEGGINFFDTANAYNLGKAEEALGTYLAELPRSSLVVLTKVWAPMGEGPNDRGLSAKHIKEQCVASLKRLNMDYVDIYMCHRPDPLTPLEETILAMEDLIRQGKILYWGVSEWPAWMIVKAKYLAREMGARSPVVNEPRYSLLYRYPESKVFPVTRSEGIGNVIFSPLAHGMLTGKYKPSESAPEGTRAADPDQNQVIKQMYWKEAYKQKAQRLVEISQDMGTTAASLAIAWCARHPAVTSVILGTRTVAQLDENLAALKVDFPAEVIAELDELFPIPEAIPQA